VAREVEKSDPESVSTSGSPPKGNHFFQLVGPVITPSFNEIGLQQSFLLTE